METLPVKDEQIEKPVTELKLFTNRVPNPNKLNWGSIIIIKNNKLMVAGWSFKGHEDKAESIKLANRMVLKRKDRHIKYDVSVQYGVSINEHLSRVTQKAEKEDEWTTPD